MTIQLISRLPSYSLWTTARLREQAKLLTGKALAWLQPTDRPSQLRTFQSGIVCSPPGADHFGVSYIALFDLFKPGPEVLRHRRLRMRRPYLSEGVFYSHSRSQVANSDSRDLASETMPGHGRWSIYALESFS
jgi:hypothetical protein